MSKIITLTTDFGTSDYYVATFKADLLQKTNGAQIIDISHHIDFYDLVQGAFYLKNSYHRFPEGTIHIAAVQTYAQSNKVIAFKKNNHYFIGPNNGLFSLVFPHDLKEDKYHVTLDRSEPWFYHELAVHAAAYLAHDLPIEELGEKITDFHEKIDLQAVTTSSQIRATIIHVDHYGNVIVNINYHQFEKLRKGRRFRIYYKSKDPITRLSKYYGEVPVGDVVCKFNSSGYLEIAVNLGNASELLNLKKHETIQIDFVDQ